MIQGLHTSIRTAELDDLGMLSQFYDPERPRSLYLDRRCEVYCPTKDELREMLTRPDVRASLGFLVVEDAEGVIRGFCALRGITQEAALADMLLGFLAPLDFATPVAEETFAYLKRRVFTELRLEKLMARCLDFESEYRQFLMQQGFTSDGVQREVVYAMGAYHDLESFTLVKQPERTD